MDEHPGPPVKDLTKELSNFFEDSRPGDPKLIALNDFLTEREYDVLLDEFREKASSNRNVGTESSLRILEAKIANTSTRINDRRATLPDYDLSREKIIDLETKLTIDKRTNG